MRKWGKSRKGANTGDSTGSMERRQEKVGNE